MKVLISGHAGAALLFGKQTILLRLDHEPQAIRDLSTVHHVFTGARDITQISVASIEDAQSLLQQNWSNDRAFRLFCIALELHQAAASETSHEPLRRRCLTKLNLLIELPAVMDSLEKRLFSARLPPEFKMQTQEIARDCPNVSILLSKIVELSELIGVVSDCFDQIREDKFSPHLKREDVREMLIHNGLFRDAVYQLRNNHPAEFSESSYPPEYLPIIKYWLNSISARALSAPLIRAKVDRESLVQVVQGRHIKAPEDAALNRRQSTVAGPVCLDGIGLHSGRHGNLIIRPAPDNHGIAFLRTKPRDGHVHIAASSTNLTTTEHSLVLGNSATGAVATVQHLLSCLHGLEIDNALIEIDAPEVPALDGSAAFFVDAIDAVGIIPGNAHRLYLKILRPVRVSKGAAFAELLPSEHGLQLDVEIEFESSVIGRQRRVLNLSPDHYREDIARARTFGFINDVERMWKAGFALGASLENSIAIGDDSIINPEGLRYTDEFVRHKILDAVGDLALARHNIIGTYRSFRPGHRLNCSLLRELFSDQRNYTFSGSVSKAKRIIASRGATFNYKTAESLNEFFDAVA